MKQRDEKRQMENPNSSSPLILIGNRKRKSAFKNPEIPTQEQPVEEIGHLQEACG